jgi:hypothetical protein
LALETTFLHLRSAFFLQAVDTPQGDVHITVVNSEMNCYPLPKYMDSSIPLEDENWFSCLSHHEVIELYHIWLTAVVTMYIEVFGLLLGVEYNPYIYYM